MSLLKAIRKSLAENLPTTDIDQPLGWKGRGNTIISPSGQVHKEGSTVDQNIVHQWLNPSQKYAEARGRDKTHWMVQFNAKQFGAAQPDAYATSFDEAISLAADAGDEAYIISIYAPNTEVPCWEGTQEKAQREDISYDDRQKEKFDTHMSQWRSREESDMMEPCDCGKPNQEHRGRIGNRLCVHGRPMARGTEPEADKRAVKRTFPNKPKGEAFLGMFKGLLPESILAEEDNNFYDELKELARTDVSVLKNLVNLQKLYQGDDPQLSDKKSTLAAGVVLQKLYLSNPKAAHYLGRMQWEPELVNWMGFFDQVGNNTLAQFLGINSMEEIPLGQAGGDGDVAAPAGGEEVGPPPSDAEVPDLDDAGGKPVDVDPSSAADEIKGALG